MTKTKKFEILNFGHCDLFEIWDLLFGIFSTPFLYSRKFQRLLPLFVTVYTDFGAF
jgi:hypothetical protein